MDGESPAANNNTDPRSMPIASPQRRMLPPMPRGNVAPRRSAERSHYSPRESRHLVGASWNIVVVWGVYVEPQKPYCSTADTLCRFILRTCVGGLHAGAGDEFAFSDGPGSGKNYRPRGLGV